MSSLQARTASLDAQPARPSIRRTPRAARVLPRASRRHRRLRAGQPRVAGAPCGRHADPSCLAVDAESSMLVGIAALRRRRRGRRAVLVAARRTRDNPLVAALSARRRSSFRSRIAPNGTRRRRPSTPFGTPAVHVVPLGVRAASRSRRRVRAAAAAARRRSRADDPLGRHASSARSSIRSAAAQRSPRARKQGRERSLLYNIINAVTDPILLTDTEGRLLIANARALTLFTASEEESEGRRGAVRMNNMLLSSALSSKAIEETGATRRELLLVNPVDGSDLLFELLSTVDRRSARRAPASSRFCATSPTCGAPARRSRRTTASCASPRRRRAPRATA